ncbi:MAG: helix-turn-helix domain-containing protein [Actinobacteria bacterium]|nr:helix-turn-helix domain-containing protein [Actinomycetota bacterium]
MAKGIPIDPKTKAEIVRKVRDEGMRVVEASEQYNISSKSIYTWLREGVVDGNRNLILENNRLKKELEQAYRLLGRATAEMQKSKK